MGGDRCAPGSRVRLPEKIVSMTVIGVDIQLRSGAGRTAPR